MNEELGFKALKLIKKLLKDQFFLTCGTALGAYRDGNFLPDDIDIDIGIFGRENREAVKTILLENGFKERQVNPKFTGYHLSVEKDVLIDVHFFDEEGGSYQCYCKHQKPCIGFPTKFSKLKKIKFKGLDFNIPLLTEEYLTYVYGDWKDKNNKKSAKQHG